MRISQSTARRLALQCQGLDGQWKLPKGKEGVAQVIERLGYVQIDTIAVVQRAHHHTLWCRRPDYAPQMLHELQARDRGVFEYWAPAASYIPMCDYRYYLQRMRAFAERSRTRQWLEDNTQVIQEVRGRIRKEGPLGSADFKAPPEFRRGTWWSWKPAKRALETLFSMGELMVTERRNFQRIYDLRERVLPPGTDTTEPDVDEMGRFMTRWILGTHGVASVNDTRWRGQWWRKVIPEAMQELSDSGEATPVDVEGAEGETYYALTEVLEEVSKECQSRTSLHVLSPFDNLVISRRRLKQLFDFDYRLECYTPAAKRKYGYFSLPILWGEQFVGRMDSKADRKSATFIVRQLTFEPDVANVDDLLPVLAERLRAFVAFNGCEEIIVERTEPPRVRAALERELGIGD